MFEAYSVAVRISLTDLVTPALTIISRGMRTIQSDAAGAQRSVTELERRLQSIRNLGLVGGAFAGLGTAGLSMFDAPLKAARDYQLELTKFTTLNLGDAVNKQADKFARSADIMGVSAKQLMHTMSESVGLFGSYAEAQKLAPKLAELNMANSAIFGGKVGAIDEGGVRSLMKFIDRRGGTKDEASFLRNLNLAEKMVTGSGGFVKFRDLDQFSQHGGTAFRGLSDAGILNMALLLQEQGGSRAGTSLMSAYQNWIAGRTTKVASHEMVSLGLGTMVEKSIGTVGGKPQTRSYLQLDPTFSAAFQANPVDAIRSMVVPAIIRKYGGGEDVILKVVNDLLSNRTGSGQASIISTQLLQVMRDANLARNAMGADAVMKAWRDDPNSKFLNLQARWTDTLRELGTTVLPAAIWAVEGLTKGLKTVIDLAHAFPKVTQGALLLFGTLSAGAAFGGSLALATAGVKALGLAIGVGGVASGAGLAGMAAMATVGIGALAYAIHDLYKATHHDPVKLSEDGERRSTDPGTRKRLGLLDVDFMPTKLLNNRYESDFAGSMNLNFNPVAEPKRQGATINNRIVMPNGRVLAEVVTHEQAREAGRPQSSGGAFDSHMHLGPAGGW